ncbi:hypothetical protein KC19_6G182500 [Ceratodon purpureus]|uniref:Uncharacterized protein n=1 Tax=Ceratodon purpureus TaxID=3225 RepID=A0A8T0HG19_CERPU|nr:hypothetical protein KC19_6G182500 [Ceratodon purpureus]
MVEGMVPEKLLLWSSRMVRFGRLQRGVGMAPERWFPESLSRMRLVQMKHGQILKPGQFFRNDARELVIRKIEIS